MQAHVVCQIQNPGMNAVTNRFEWNVNGMVVSSVEYPVNTVYQLEVDVPEHSNVRLDVAAIGADGQQSWSSSDTINVGAAPPPVPGPPPGNPTVGNLTVAYWW
jgi:hypothetical protein